MSMIQAVSYNFSTVENPLSDGGKFSAQTGYTALKVPSAGVCVSVGTNGNMYWSAAIVAPSGVLPADQYSEVTMIDATNSIGPGVRMSATQGYLATVTPGAGTGGTFFKQTGAGAYVSLGAGTWTSSTAANGDVWRLQVVGTTLTIFQNGVSRGTLTDATFATGAAGLYCSDTSGGVSLFAAGANQSATPTFSPVAGSYAGTQTVTITSASGGTIYYTTDGSTPTHASSSIASGAAISIAVSETVKAIASQTNFLDSVVGVAAYTILPAAIASASEGTFSTSMSSTAGMSTLFRRTQQITTTTEGQE